MAMDVVDRLEIVDVDHHQTDRIAVALGAVELGCEQLLELAMAGETGQIVGDRLALDVEVQVDVCQRERRARCERAQQLEIVLAEAGVFTGDRDQPVWSGRPARSGRARRSRC